ncbi:hypothetical protein TELCIR_23827 [Teladorsagia circumcincta]|uniref:Uncharacterized protein n=1 Tax=Teladorsagia circumcincta TaxID=45464 RepID=A0A2G9TBN2_TELCI|nr:hypothetical protein TELCIR_23827 [Teladorsagia circumcincta]
MIRPDITRIFRMSSDLVCRKIRKARRHTGCSTRKR